MDGHRKFWYFLPRCRPWEDMWDKMKKWADAAQKELAPCPEWLENRNIGLKAPMAAGWNSDTGKKWWFQRYLWYPMTLMRQFWKVKVQLQSIAWSIPTRVWNHNTMVSHLLRDTTVARNRGKMSWLCLTKMLLCIFHSGLLWTLVKLGKHDMYL